jgi:hypothetical protein
MRTRALPFLIAVAFALPAFGATKVTIVNINAPGVGFNDPTPALPVGGNTGTTVGEQRLIAFQFAADLWGSTLDSAVEVRIQASFEPLSCTATAATLGSAGAIQVVRDFPGALFAGTWYHIALANKLAFEDLIPPDPSLPSPATDDIRARFNANIGQPTCLAGSGWYYGLDTGHAPNQINLATVLLHEFAHGLGFSSFTSVTSGALLAGMMDVYSKFYLDDTTGKTREEMTDAERKASAINPRAVSWNGAAVTAAVPVVLALGTPLLRVTAPAPIAGDYQVGPASFGPALAGPGVSGSLVLALDAANASGPSATDACSPITNAADVAGRVALVDRGTCGFVVKVKNAQDAGAIGVVVGDNAAGGPPAGLGGADPTITIPAVRITLADAQKLKAALAGGPVEVTLGVDATLRAGADRAGRPLLYTPNPVQPGSTVSHWDTLTTPNQLMEPAINNDLKLAVDVPVDMTRALLRDVGWYPDGDLDGVPDDAGDQCLGSDLRATVVINACDTGVPNTFFTNGCTIRDLVAKCEPPPDPYRHDRERVQEKYERCVHGLLQSLRHQGFLTKKQEHRIEKALDLDEDGRGKNRCGGEQDDEGSDR